MRSVGHVIGGLVTSALQIETGKIASIFLFSIHFLLLTLSNWHLGGFSRTNSIVLDPQQLWRMSYLEPSILIFLVCYWVFWWSGWSVEWKEFLYLANSSNNWEPPPTISLFSAMSSANRKLSDDLVGHALGLKVRDAAINQPIAHHHLQPHHPQLCPLTMTSFLMIWLGALWAKRCVIKIGGPYLSFR